MARLDNKTAVKLKAAFWELFEERDISSIRIDEIVALAGYSRSLFYTYFRDIYDLYEHIENETLEKFKLLLNHFRVFFKSGKVGKKDDDALLEEISPIYTDIERFLKTLFTRKENKRFLFRVVKVIKQHFMDDFNMPQNRLEPDIIELYIEGLVASHIAIMVHSFETYGYLDLKKCINLAKVIYFQNPHSVLSNYRKDV